MSYLSMLFCNHIFNTFAKLSYIHRKNFRPLEMMENPYGAIKELVQRKTSMEVQSQTGLKDALHNCRMYKFPIEFVADKHKQHDLREHC